MQIFLLYLYKNFLNRFFSPHLPVQVNVTTVLDYASTLVHEVHAMSLVHHVHLVLVHHGVVHVDLVLVAEPRWSGHEGGGRELGH